MTKEMVIEKLTARAIEYGFSIRKTKWSQLGINVMADDGIVNFVILGDITWDTENMRTYHKLTMKATIAMMDTNITPEGLLAQAERIASAARLCMRVNADGLEYVEQH